VAQAVEYLEFKAEVPKAKEAKRLMAERIKEKKAEAKALVAAAPDKKAAKEIKKEQKDMMDDLKEEMKECKQKFVDKKAEVTAQKGSEVSEQTLTNCCAPFHTGVWSTEGDPAETFASNSLGPRRRPSNCAKHALRGSPHNPPPCIATCWLARLGVWPRRIWEGRVICLLTW